MQVASTGLDSTVRIWDVATGQLPEKFHDAAKGCRAVAFSPDGSKVAAAGLERKVFVWQITDEKLLHSLKGHQFSIRGLCFADNGAKLASASDDMTVKIWNLTNARLRASNIFQPAKNSNVFLFFIDVSDHDERQGGEDIDRARQFGHQHRFRSRQQTPCLGRTGRQVFGMAP